MLVHNIGKAELTTGSDKIVSAIKRFKVLVTRDVVVKEANGR